MMFSDIDFGTEEYGYLPTIPNEDPDDQDMRYQRHLKKMGISATVRDGYVAINSSQGFYSPSDGALQGAPVVESRAKVRHLTEGQLRKIVKQTISEIYSKTPYPKKPLKTLMTYTTSDIDEMSASSISQLKLFAVLFYLCKIYRGKASSIAELEENYQLLVKRWKRDMSDPHYHDDDRSFGSWVYQEAGMEFDPQQVAFDYEYALEEWDVMAEREKKTVSAQPVKKSSGTTGRTKSTGSRSALKGRGA
jgi:hypothetical protein